MTTIRMSHPGRVHRGFTLLELLVVTGIIVLLAVITVISVQALSRDARQTAAVNTVKASLGTARALAMRNNRPVMVVFRARPQGERDQYIEVIYAQWSGESYPIQVGTGFDLVDRFVPINDAPEAKLAPGIMIAGPRYIGTGAGSDDRWRPTSNIYRIQNAGEINGQMYGVMFSADGSVITQNSLTDSNRQFVDFNNDGLQRTPSANLDYNLGVSVTFAQYIAMSDHVTFDQEPFIVMVPFLAIYSDREVREVTGDGDWTTYPNIEADITFYVNQFADRIHFNRYTGVLTR